MEDDILESCEEHHVADLLVMELSRMKAKDERFTAKMTVLIVEMKRTAPRKPSQPGALKKTIDALIA